MKCKVVKMCHVKNDFSFQLIILDFRPLLTALQKKFQREKRFLLIILSHPHFNSVKSHITNEIKLSTKAD